MKFRLCTIFNLFNKKILRKSLVFTVISFLWGLWGIILLFVAKVDAVQIILFCGTAIIWCVFVECWISSPRKMTIVNNELHYVQYMYNWERHFSFISKRGLINYDRVYITIKRITKIEYNQNAIEKLFKVCNATIHGEILFNNKRGEPYDLEKYPFFVTIYGIRKINTAKEELNKLIGAKNEDNCQ